MSKKTRAAMRFYVEGFPTAAAVVSTAILSPFGSWTATGLAALVGASAWVSMIRRRSQMLPQRGR